MTIPVQIHRELGRTEALHYIWWDQETDPTGTNPGEVFPGHIWRTPSTGQLKERNGSNTAWVSKGYLSTVSSVALLGKPFVIHTADSALTGARRLVAGTGITLQTSTPGQLRIAAATVDEGAGLPGGGDEREVLIKESGTDFDAAWSSVARAFVRGEVEASTGSLSDNARESIEVALGQSFELYKIEASHNCWVVGYQTDAARTADDGRLIDEDPATASGVLFEFVFDDDTGLTIRCQPRVSGENHDSPLEDTCYLAVQNLSGGTATITLTFTRIVTEAT